MLILPKVWVQYLQPEQIKASIVVRPSNRIDARVVQNLIWLIHVNELPKFKYETAFVILETNT